MQPYIDDINDLRTKFAYVDKHDPKSIRKWFEDHPHLTTNDHAQIAGKAASYIRKLKKRAGIIGKMPANLPKSKAVKKVVIGLNPPENWDTHEWLSSVVGTHSVKRIAEACNVSRRTIRRRLAKHNLHNTFTVKSKNKCYSKAWCHRHYVELEWTQEECAKKAGICQQAFANWLNKFKIPVRTALETVKSHNTTQIWVRGLIKKLKSQKIVRKVYLRNDHVHVRFMNYFWETYYVNRNPTEKRPPSSYIITKKDAILKKVPKVYPEYETNMSTNIYDENGIIQSPHIIINRNEFDNASLIEQRMAIHEFCRQITQRKWMWPEHPDHILASEWDSLQNFKPSKYMYDGMFSIFARNGKRPALGRKLIEHFFDISEFSDVFRSPRLVMKMTNVLAAAESEFNFHNLLRIFCCGAASLPGDHKTFRISDPAAYAVLFQRLGVKGKILDLYPGFGNRAIAAALENLEYYTIPDERFTKALNKGFHDFVGLNYNEWGQEKVDVLIYDNNFNNPDMSIIKEYTKFAKRMMVFVPHRLKLEYQTKFKPTSFVKIKTRWFQKAPDYIFIW